MYLEVHQLIEPRGTQAAAEGTRRVVAAAVAGERACVPSAGVAEVAPARMEFVSPFGSLAQKPRPDSATEKPTG